MARINTRSPYWVSVDNTELSYAILKLYVYTGNSSNVPSEPNYTIRKSVLSGQDTVFFEVSELIRDELDVVFNGDYNGQAVWVKIDTSGYDSSNDEVENDSETTNCF